MLSELVVHHWQKKNGRSEQDLLCNVGVSMVPPFMFRTCLRDIVVTHTNESSSFQAGQEHIIGYSGYRFLLEVICGLHSPVIGETEVFGQFKLACAEYTTKWSDSALEKLFRQLQEDAKLVRQKHLQDLGSQSYGSYVRRTLKSAKHVQIIGGGQLAQEIVTWIAKQENRKITVCVRDVEKAKTQFPSNVEVLPLEKVERADATVICAPLESHEIAGLLDRQQIVVDLRGEVESGALQSLLKNTKVLDLPLVFNEISLNQKRSHSKRIAALQEIDQLTDKRIRTMEIRPFGWDDVCA